MWPVEGFGAGFCEISAGVIKGETLCPEPPDLPANDQPGWYLAARLGHSEPDLLTLITWAINGQFLAASDGHPVLSSIIDQTSKGG
jgi:hypothetical protein